MYFIVYNNDYAEKISNSINLPIPKLYDRLGEAEGKVRQLQTDPKQIYSFGKFKAQDINDLHNF